MADEEQEQKEELEIKGFDIKNFKMSKFVFYFCIAILFFAVGFYFGTQYGVLKANEFYINAFKDCICPVLP